HVISFQVLYIVTCSLHPAVQRPPRSSIFPYTSLFRSLAAATVVSLVIPAWARSQPSARITMAGAGGMTGGREAGEWILRHAPRGDRKSTRLNSRHVASAYALCCLKKICC